MNEPTVFTTGGSTGVDVAACPILFVIHGLVNYEDRKQYVDHPLLLYGEFGGFTHCELFVANDEKGLRSRKKTKTSPSRTM
jgi:hypothetical protein